MEQKDLIDSCLQKIEKCNKILEELIKNEAKANEDAESPMSFYKGKISYKNKIQLEREYEVTKLRNIFKEYNLGVRPFPYSNLNSSSNRYLAFIDILGFGKIVERNTEVELTTKMEHLIRDIQMCLTQEELGKARMRLYNYGLASDLEQAKINNLIFSDTILFWTNDNSINSFLELIKVVQMFFMGSAYFYHWGLRGVITYGELAYLDYNLNHQNLLINQSSIFGKSIVEAYNFEKKQEWMGCIISPKAIESFLVNSPSMEQKDFLNKLVIEYDVPYKRNETEKHTVIKWIQEETEKKRNEEMIGMCFKIHQKEESIVDEVKVKYENTIKFADFVSKK